jgi:hypothetical protein
VTFVNVTLKRISEPILGLSPTKAIFSEIGDEPCAFNAGTMAARKTVARTKQIFFTRVLPDALAEWPTFVLIDRT